MSMKSVGEILDNLANIDAGVICQECGNVLTMVGKQYTARCNQCGINITLTPAYLARIKQAEYQARYGEERVPVKCHFCSDSGLVTLKEQMDDHVGNYAYRCLCQAGQKRTDLSGLPVVPAAKVIAFVPHLRLVVPEGAEERG